MARANFFRQHGRLLSFFAVLAITSTLVLVLFDEARAVEITGSGPAFVERSTSQVELTFTISIPESQLLPIEGLAVYLEQTDGDDKVDPTLVASATCASAAGCADPDTTGTKAGGIVSIDADGSNADATIGYISVTKPDYDYAAGYGYGYGTGVLGGTLVDGDAYTEGYGYGYGSGYGGEEGGELAYTVVLSPTELGLGHYWVTFVVETGSDTIGDVSSAAKYLRVRSPESTPPADDDPTPTPTPTVTPTLTPTVSPTVTPPTTTPTPPPVPLPPQAIENGFRGQATVTPGAGQETVSFDLSSFPGLNQIELRSKPGEQITLTIEQTTTPPASATPIPAGFSSSQRFLSIEVEGGDGSETDGEIGFTLNASDLNGHEPATGTLLHYKLNTWFPEETQHHGGGVYTAKFQSLSPFAITFDDEAPVVGALTPLDGATVGVKSAIGAALSDNRGIDAALTTLLVDGQKVAATVTATGAYYTPLVALLEGVHTATLTAVDASGHETVKEWTFTTASDKPDTTVPTPVSPTTTSPTTASPTTSTPTAASPTPEDGKKGGIPGFEVAALLAALGAALLVLRRRKA